MTITDGGAAFPQNPEWSCGRGGMSLRDWFAGQAMAAIIQKMPLHGVNTDGSCGEFVSNDSDRRFKMEAIANAAFDYADAMLAAREEANEGG